MYDALMLKIDNTQKRKADKAITTRLALDDFARLESIARKAGVTPSWLLRRIAERAIIEGIEIAETSR